MCPDAEKCICKDGYTSRCFINWRHETWCPSNLAAIWNSSCCQIYSYLLWRLIQFTSSHSIAFDSHKPSSRTLSSMFVRNTFIYFLLCGIRSHKGSRNKNNEQTLAGFNGSFLWITISTGDRVCVFRFNINSSRTERAPGEAVKLRRDKQPSFLFDWEHAEQDIWRC